MKLLGYNISFRKDRVKREPTSVRSISTASRLKRRPRSTISKSRKYEAADSTRFLSSWSTFPSPINFQISSYLHVLVARSRDAFQNNDLVKRAVSLKKSKIVGHTGVRFVPKFKTKGVLDKKINRQLSDLFSGISKVGAIDVTGKMSLIDIQNRVEHQLFIDGEYICVHKYGKQYKYGFAIEEIDPMLLPVKLNKDLDNGNLIRCGIELNSEKRPVAYHFIKNKNSDNRNNDYNYHRESDTVRVVAENVTHLFVQDFPDQLRGVPRTSTALFSVEVLRKYLEAELIGARIGASSSGFFVKQKDHIEPFTGQEGISVNGDDPSDEEEEIDDEIDEVEAGSIKMAPTGYDFKSWDLNRVNNAFKDFVTMNSRLVASSVDVSYSALTNDYQNVSFSSLRDAKLVDDEIVKQSQVFHIQHFFEPVTKKAMQSALDFGSFVLSGSRVFSSELIVVGEYVPVVAKWVDPVKTAQAYRILNVDLAVMSRQRICGQLGIDDWEAEFEAIKLENENYPLHNDQQSSEQKEKVFEEDEQESKKSEKGKS